MIDPFSADKVKQIINKEIANTKEHICYGIDSVEKLMYARGRLSALEALLQDIRNLQKEDIDGTIDKP
jgi:hypothetical protein